MKMIFIIFVKLLLSSFIYQIFVGNWYFCDDKGLYGEIYFKKKSFEMVYEGNGNMNEFYNYTLDNGTLYIQSEKDSTINYKGHFEYISADTLIFHYKYDHETEWSYFRLIRLDEILIYMNKQKKHDEYFNRLMNADCNNF